MNTVQHYDVVPSEEVRWHTEIEENSMKFFVTPPGRAGSDQVDYMEESVNAHIEQMFYQKAKQEILSYGVGRTTMKIQDGGSDRRLEAQKRECDGQMISHAGRALELSIQIIYARGKDRIMGRGYPGVTSSQLKEDTQGGHSLLKLYRRVVQELGKQNLDKAFEDKYQYALHKGITDIYVDDNLLGSIFLPGEEPFTERSTTRIADGEEHTMDHSTSRGLFSHPDGTSNFAKMPYDTFEKFLEKADAVYYEGDAPGKENRRNMRWGNYAARDHESGRLYVTIGVYFFARLVKNIITLGHEGQFWHEDFLNRLIVRRKHNVMNKIETMAMQNLEHEIALPEVISDDKIKQYFISLHAYPDIGNGNYDHLHNKLNWSTEDISDPS